MTFSDDILKKSDIEFDNYNEINNVSSKSNDTDNNVDDINNNNCINIISTSTTIFIRSNSKMKTKNFRFNIDELINEYLHIPTRNELSFEDHILLWWNGNDFRRFKCEAINEIKDIVKIHPHFNVKQAMSVMYQLESQELIDNTCRNSRRFITLQQQINDKLYKNNINKSISYSHNNNNNNIKKDYDDSRKDHDHSDDNITNDEDCVIQIRSRFLCSRKHFHSSKKQEDNTVVPNNSNIVTLYHANYKREEANNNSNINNNNRDDCNVHDHDNHSDENSKIVVDEIVTNKLVLKTNNSQRSNNYHFILTAYLILWLCAVWGIVFHQVVIFNKYQKQLK